MLLQWRALHKDGEVIIADYFTKCNTQVKFSQIRKEQLERFSWIIRDKTFSLNCLTGNFEVDGKIIGPDCGRSNCGVGLIAFIRMHQDSLFPTKKITHQIESVNLGYKVGEFTKYVLQIDYKTLEYKLLKESFIKMV